MESTSVALAAIGVLATCVGGLIWVIKRMFTDVQPLIKEGIAASRQVAEAVKVSAEEGAAREEREQERHSQSMQQFAGLTKAIAAIPSEVEGIVKPLADRNYDAITHIGTQTVETQIVTGEVIAAPQKAQ